MAKMKAGEWIRKMVNQGVPKAVVLEARRRLRAVKKLRAADRVEAVEAVAMWMSNSIPASVREAQIEALLAKHGRGPASSLSAVA